MSSASGIRAQRPRDRLTREPGAGRLARIVTIVVRLGQAAPLRPLCALAALGLSLHVRHDPARLLVAGGAGLVLLALVLLREPATRLLFTASGLLLLALYAWSATESVELAVVLDGHRLAATVGEVTVSADVPTGPAGRVGLDLSSSRPVWIGEPREPLPDPSRLLSTVLESNLASGVSGLELRDPHGELLASPGAFWEPDEAGAPPIPADPGEESETRDGYLVFGGGDLRDLRARLDLINGGPPVTLLLRLDNDLNGLAVQAWPNRREVSLYRVRRGSLDAQLAGGSQAFRRPPLAGLQSLLREALRAWLVGLTLLALGALLAPLARLLLPADWWAPGWSGPVFAVLLALSGLAATAWIASDVLEHIPHVQDSVGYLFQAKTFALGRLSAPLPPVLEAFEQDSVLMRNGAWFSKFPPGYPLVLAVGALAGAPWIVSPLAASLTLLLLFCLGRALYGSATALLALLLLLCSPFFLFMSGSMMSHPTGLLLTTLGLLLVTRSVSSDSTWLPILAGISLGWLTASRQLTGLAVTAPALVWLAVRRLSCRRSLSPTLWLALGWSWPVLGLLAYNRALTGDPFHNPYELWSEFDRIGFGPAVGMHAGHDLGRGLQNTLANLTALETDLFGWPIYLTLAFALLPFATGRARAGDWLCGAVSLSLMTAYIAYWADGIVYGPRYFYEMSGCLALLTARGVASAADATSGRTRSLLRRRSTPASASCFVLLVAGLIAGNLFQNIPRQIDLHRGYNSVDGRRQAIVWAAGLHHALVLVPTTQPSAWWDYGSVFSANDPLLSGDVIYARDLGPLANRRTLAAFPDRTAYLLSEGKLSRLSL
jgi:4-amino-4-deoxy-L-arabinose transferase-like glycosyltransferase